MDLGDKYDITALFVAAERQQTAMCEELIGLGADPNYGIEADIIKPRLHLVKGIVRPPHSHPAANSNSPTAQQPNSQTGSLLGCQDPRHLDGCSAV